ncbi:MAG TPA: type I-C CRISPR-associated protein Cas8c/Csd1 [Anaerolineales bacterium]|mgnify:CR=1 FL=1|jgi:CRISPR-associated protein Csd1|nr:type I-C CRISPR-associated protein Cas8c/Csd1 [Anaerolineales bacterium]
MILQALTKYYDILSNDPESDIAPPGYSAIGISFALNVSAKGELLDVFPLFEQVQRGRKMEDRPRRMIVPELVKRAVNISANYLWDNCVYVLGISDKEAKDPEYNVKRFEAFRQRNIELLSKVDAPAAKAVIAFLGNYDLAKGREHPKIAPHLETIVKGGNLVFMFNGSFVHEDPAIRKAWEEYKSSSDAVMIQCLVTGETAPLARLHPSLKGIRDANPTGATLVGFNARAYESYNREQGLNSPVSEKAAFAYTTALNYLLSSTNENRKFTIGDTTVVYWAESEKKEYAKAFMGMCEPEIVEVETPIEEEEAKPARNKKAEKKLKKVAEKVRRVQALDVKKLLDGLDENPRFYILGLAPNAARVSVRFFHSDPFDKIIEKIMKHYKDLEIVKEFEDQHTYITIQDILKETMSKKASDPEASPLMAGSVFRAILDNTPYPAALYNAVINRIRADQDDPKKFIKKINYERAAIIKAYLLRKYRNQPQHPIQEVLVMSLNEQSTVPAYVLGRLFAVLEKVQQEAVGDVNASIKDRYFTSACASPASVFPILLRLSQHHISKVGAYYHDKRIEKILNLLDIEKNPIPSHLTLDEQGVFVLGYYHERKDLWTSKKPVESTSTETN